MQPYDLIMLAVLLISTYRGYRKGLAWQIAAIASMVVSYVVAYRFRDPVAAYIEMEDPWRSLVAMLGLFIASSLVIWFLFHTVKGAIEKAKLKEFDQQLGAILGAVKGVALCVVITLFTVSLLQADMSQQIVNSRSGGYIARLLDQSEMFIPHELHQALAPYLEKAEDRLQERTMTEDDLRVLPDYDWVGEANRSDADAWGELSDRNDLDWR